MSQWKYADATNQVVTRTLPDGSTQSMLAALLGGGEQIDAFIPPAPVVPATVSMRQARRALLGAGLLSQVDAAIASLPSPEKEAAAIDWEYAQEVQRHHGLVPVMAQALGMTNAQLDALFIAAESL